MVRKRILKHLCMLLATALISCSANNKQTQSQQKFTSLTNNLDVICKQFIDELGKQGITAQSYYTYFIKEGEVNKRHFVKFKNNIERYLKKYDYELDIFLHPAPETVFFLSKYAKSLEFDKVSFPSSAEGAHMANEFYNGTQFGWVSMTTMWQQFQRFVIGDSQFISSLPDSVRVDVGKPLKYILRISLIAKDSNSITKHPHDIILDMIEVQSGQSVFNKAYPLNLTYRLK